MWLNVRCSLELDFEVPTPLILMLRPRNNALQWIIREDYIISPMVPVDEYTDVYGNLCQRLTAPEGKLSILSSADVNTSFLADKNPGAPFIEIPQLPHHLLGYLLPSRYCESDCFNEMASSITDGERPGYDQVAAIEAWIRDNIRYDPGTSDVPLSAIEVNQQHSGVCRDMAHLGIALCRSLSIPARIVVGYLHELKPMDMHAWFQAYVGDRWYTFDATQQGPKDGYVAVGYGSDATDVALINQFGPKPITSTQEVTVEKITDQG